MVTTSSNRGFQIPTVSSDSNIWGNELNATIASLDTSLGGSLTLQSSAAMSVALASSQAQFSRIVVQGALPSNFTLTFPSASYASGNYQVWNNSSAGGGAVVCTTGGGGANCSVGPGAMRSVNTDGINAQFADNQATAALVPTFINKFRNPGMDVYQRGVFPTQMPGVGAYTLDGWRVGATSGAPAVTQVYNVHLSGSALRITGNNAAMTGLFMIQNIESYLAVQLLGTTPSAVVAITVRYDIYNASGADFTPQLYSAYANARDNFTAVTNDLAPVNLQLCPNNAFTTVAYTFVPSANLANGYQLCLTLGTALNNLGGTIDISHCDVRASPGVASGINSNPPTVELRPINEETELCQRYLYVAPSRWLYADTYANFAGQVGYTTAYFPVSMRQVPTATNLRYTLTNATVLAPTLSVINAAFGVTGTAIGYAAALTLTTSSSPQNIYTAEL